MLQAGDAGVMKSVKNSNEHSSQIYDFSLVLRSGAVST